MNFHEMIREAISPEIEALQTLHKAALTEAALAHSQGKSSQEKAVIEERVIKLSIAIAGLKAQTVVQAANAQACILPKHKDKLKK